MTDTAPTIASDTKIRAALREFNTDANLDVTKLAAAFGQLRDTLATISAINAGRNAAIAAWAEKFRALGVPDRGFEIDGERIEIYTTATSGSNLNVGKVSALDDPAPFIVDATEPYVGHSRSRSLDVRSLPDLDRRK